MFIVILPVTSFQITSLGPYRAYLGLYVCAVRTLQSFVEDEKLLIVFQI